MKDKSYYNSKLMTLFESGTISEYRKHFEEVNKWFLEIIQSLHESQSKVKSYQSDLESKYIRFGFTNQSIIKLSKGIEFKVRNKKIDTVDIFSILSILRMQFENFINIYYLYFDKITEAEKEFRYRIYMLHGLIKQSKFPVTFSQNKAKKKDILKEIEEIKKIISDSKFNKYHHLVKNPLKPNRAKYITTKEAFKMANLDNGQLNHYWSLLSNHSHTEYISDRQYHSYISNLPKLIETVTLIFDVSLMLTSRLTFNLVSSFKGAELYYNTIPIELQTYFETWKNISKKI